MGLLRACEGCGGPDACEAAPRGGRLLASGPVLFVLADVSAREMLDTCGRDPGAVCREVFERTESSTLAKTADFVLGTPLTILLIALGAWIVNVIVGRIIEHGMRGVSNGILRERRGALRRRVPGGLLETATESNLRAEQRIRALTGILRSIAGFVILLFASIMMLSAVGVDVAPLLAGAGVLGVALGFGSQSLVKDFLSGMFILAEDQFGVGDVVDLDGEVTGAVEAVSLRTTRLRASDGTVWHVPNGAIVRVGNKSQHWARALLDVELAGDTDIDHAEHVINGVARDLYRQREDILQQPEVRGIEQRDDRTLVFRLLVKTLPADRESVSGELRRRLAEAFGREGITAAGAQADEPRDDVAAADGGAKAATPADAGSGGGAETAAASDAADGSEGPGVSAEPKPPAGG